jgi:hypothetical protein
VIACVWIAVLAPGAARAEPAIAASGAPAAAPPLAEEVAPPPPARRPRMAVSLGMGATFDNSGFQPQHTNAIPSFEAVGDVGDGAAGFSMGVYASSASGRYRSPDLPVDRLALDLMGVFRPFCARLRPTDTRYRARVARASGLELGLGYERDGQSALSGGRFGVHTGLRLELPLTPAGQATELRVHLAARRLLGLYEPLVGATKVHDTNELYAALAVAF